MQAEPEFLRSAQIVALRRFARSVGVYEEFAVAIFEEQVRSLEVQARVTRFIGVLAERRAKDAIRKSSRRVRSAR